MVPWIIVFYATLGLMVIAAIVMFILVIIWSRRG